MFAAEKLAESVVLAWENRLRAEIFLHGAVLNRYEIMQNGAWFNAVRAYRNPQHCRNTLTAGFHSAKLSPFACRIRHGKYRFDGADYQCAKHQIAGHAAHGLLFDADFQTASYGADEHSAWVELHTDYAGNEEGFPFAYRLSVRFSLGKNGLSMATTVKNTGETAMPLADGWHPYFTLGGKTDDWTLQIGSSKRLVFDGDLVPNGDIAEDVRFQTALSLQGIELDNSFILENTQPACILSGGALALNIFADEYYPYLQVYIPPERDSIALETLSGAPDCFNNGLGLLVLQPEAEKRFAARYELTAVE